MMFPPSILRFRVLDDHTRVNLWIPLVLIWPLLVVVYLLLLPCILLAAVLTWSSGRGRLILVGGPALFRLYCALRGLEIQVTEPNQSVLIYFK